MLNRSNRWSGNPWKPYIFIKFDLFGLLITWNFNSKAINKFFLIHEKNGESDSNNLKMACIGLIFGSRKLFCQAVILWNLEKSGLCRIPFYSKNFNVFIFRQKIFSGKTRFLIRFRWPVFSAHRKCPRWICCFIENLLLWICYNDTLLY